MIPVSLRLQNFLSYGTDAEPLDFTQFDVACLSGANGQGKSALLDGITWALWGQARKSSNVRKPDAELLRIGTQEMRVELVFDVEGVRYRAERWFAQSASGKTSRSGLELASYDGGAWRPLTAPSQSETQEKLDAAVGVDYDTFVNASFLLQGRSDEFTRRKPEERKEVLARILNLERYEALAEKAGERAREAQLRVDAIERDGAALDALVAALPELESRVAAAGADLAEQERQRDVLDARIAEAQETINALQRQRERAAEIGHALERLATQVQALDAEVADLDRRLERGAEILACRDRILADAERFEALSSRQAVLHAHALADRTLERRIGELERERERLHSEHAQRLKVLETELAHTAERLEALDAELAQRPSVVEQRDAAQQARKQVDALAAERQRRDALRAERETLAREVEAERVRREADLKSLWERIVSAKTDVPDVEVLEREERRLHAEAERLETLRQKKDAVERQGREAGDALAEAHARMGAVRAALDKIAEQNWRLDDASEASCPTCGTRLTEDHRHTVRQQLAADRRGLEQELAEAGEAHARATRRREEAAHEYRRLRDDLAVADEVNRARTRVEEQWKHREKLLLEIDALNGEHRRLRTQIENRGFAVMQRQRLAEVDAALGTLAFDEEAYDRVRSRADRLDTLNETLARLDVLARQRAEAAERREALRAEQAECRAAERSGTLLGTLPDQLEAARAERREVGFDPEQLREVTAELEALREAPARRADLRNAEANRDVWTQQRAARRQQRAEWMEERARLSREQAALADVEAKAEAARRAFDGATAERRDVAERVGALQQHLGGLNERVRQARQARVQRAEAARTLAAAREDVVLYRHLRQAFGKKGIPSLIIEQTLPEVEERANVLLDRLADGRMHVRLETLRDKKTGGTAETLDIIISDEMGVSRPYETFSGGEAFRVNFALRIALSQLLAERSGIRIRTLVVDEGFGTQDALGIQRLIEAINSVREDFDKILVVTHLEALKNAFPTRIEVRKDPVVGSRYELVGA